MSWVEGEGREDERREDGEEEKSVWTEGIGMKGREILERLSERMGRGT